MDIPLGVDVLCVDGLCGRSTYVIVDPITEKVTHVVVREQRFPYTEYLVPLELLIEATPEHVHLRCTCNELVTLDPFIEVEFIEGDREDLGHRYGEYRMWPYVLPEGDIVSVESERVPVGELAVRRGAKVVATDGHVGKVDEFLIDPMTDHITHLVLREGHLWGQKDVTIPVSEIARIEENTIYLKMSRRSIAALPSIPVRRG